ncbi:hypothetical protein IWQ57_000762 [Coemansia nantahalensis]|uniref:Uncharacterized protein n=1 Tax=Coemansia nantahalensis TaxID=2789366 RepID=A0ACC1K7H4_9FUNG|nr:hypothetical protein IWQ57_000762 [Coemansia nantahalensis]
MLTISMDVMFGATLSPPGKYKFRSLEDAAASNLGVAASTHFTVYTITSQEGGRRPLCDTWTFKVGSEEEGATWLSLLRFAINPTTPRRPTNVLVFLNPVSGKQRSLKLFETVVKPIFAISDTRFTLKVTESAGYASEFARTQDLSAYSAIVAVSGDGLLHEILNGLLVRSDWASLRDLPLGVVPTGTGNGLARSLDCIWPEQAAVAIARAHVRPIDIMSVTQASGDVKHCFLSATWGLIADIDIESESIRWAGAARLDVYATMRLMSLRYYGGRLHYLPADDGDSHGDGGAGGRQDAGGDEADECSVTSTRCTSQDTGMPTTGAQPAAVLHPTLTAGIQLPVQAGSLPPRWRTIEGPFAKITATNVAWLAGDFMACPRARISDGAIDVVYAGAATKWQLLPYMISSSREDYMNTEGIKHVRARAFIIEPTGLRTTSSSGGSLTATQPPLSNAAARDEGRAKKCRPQSGSLLGTFRTRSLSRSPSRSGTASTDGTPPRPPVPVRVRSELYTSYHQQTVGRGSSLMVQGLGPGGASVGDGSLSAPVMADDWDSAPQAPAQVAFSLRSDTALAAAVMSDQDAVSPSPPTMAPGVSESQPVTHAATPEPSADTRRAHSAVPEGAGEDACRLVGTNGIMVLDGEVAELGPLKVECLPSLVSVICPPWLNENRTAQVSSAAAAAAAATKAPEHIAGTLSHERSTLSLSAV